MMLPSEWSPSLGTSLNLYAKWVIGCSSHHHLLNSPKTHLTGVTHTLATLQQSHLLPPHCLCGLSPRFIPSVPLLVQGSTILHADGCSNFLLGLPATVPLRLRPDHAIHLLTHESTCSSRLHHRRVCLTQSLCLQGLSNVRNSSARRSKTSNGSRLDQSDNQVQRHRTDTL